MENVSTTQWIIYGVAALIIVGPSIWSKVKGWKVKLPSRKAAEPDVIEVTDVRLSQLICCLHRDGEEGDEDIAAFQLMCDAAERWIEEHYA